MTDALVVDETVSEKGNQDTPVNCIACRQAIKYESSKCHYCGSYQVRWRNWLPVIGTVFGILTFAASTLAVVLATATDFWEEAFGTDSIEILAYSSNQMSVLNSGSRRLLVEDVTVEADEIGHYSIHLVHKVVSEGSVYVHRNSTEKTFHKERRLIGKVSDKQWAEMKHGKVAGISPAFFSTGHPHLDTLMKRWQHLRTFETKCRVRFRVVKSNTESEEVKFPCVGILMADKSN